MPPRLSASRFSSESESAAKVEERSQRCALPPCRDIPRTKISHRRATGPFRNHRGVPDLERCPEFGVMGDRLAVRRDPIDFGQRDARAVGQRNRRLREALREQHVERR